MSGPQAVIPAGDGVPALDAEQAARHVATGGLVAYPTETVWGLGADARRDDAVQRLWSFKERPAGQPVAILVDEASALGGLGAELSSPARRLVEAFWPGPLTLVVRCTASLAPGVAREDGAVGIRCSPHPVARALAASVRQSGLGPLTATSLNRSGEPPAATRAAAEACVAAAPTPDRPRLVGGEDAGARPPSSVVDVTGPAPVVLREGAIAAARIEAVSRGAGQA